jgi:hypothetical protein
MFVPSNSGYEPLGAIAQSNATDARSDAREALSATELLRHDVDKLLMITEALWSILKKQHGYSDENLAALVKEIDLRDGRLDGKSGGPSPSPCPQCGKINSARRAVCIYCGIQLPISLFGG